MKEASHQSSLGSPHVLSMNTELGTTLPDTAEELLFLLKAPGQELSRLLSAARKLLDSPQYVIPRKAHFLLDWASNLLLKTSSRHTDPEKAAKEGYVHFSFSAAPSTKYQFLRRSPPLLLPNLLNWHFTLHYYLYRVTLIFLNPSLWSFFDSLLHNEEVRKNATIQPKLISVVDGVFQHLHYRSLHSLSTPTDDALAEVVARVFNYIFQVYSQFLRPRFDQFTQTLASISSLALKFMATEAAEAQNGPFSPLVDSFLVVLTTALKVYRQLCFDASMQNKVFTAVVEDMLAHFLGIVHLASRLLQTRTDLPEEQSSRIRQVLSLIEKTLQHALFSQTHLAELNSAFSPSIDYGQDCFLLMAAKKGGSFNDNERGAPVAKRSKTGDSNDMAPKFESNGPVSKSYSKKLFDWLLTQATSKTDESAEIALESIPFLFRLCLTSIFAGRGRFAASISDSFSSPLMGTLDSSAMETDENSTAEFNASMSQKTMKILWSLFNALQRICTHRIRSDTSSLKGSKQDATQIRHLQVAIASNTALLSLVREYDIYSHSQVGMSERWTYLSEHVTEFVSLANRFSTLDVLFSSLKVLLEIDQTFLEDYLGSLLAVVWKQPSATQLHSDAFTAAMVSVYGLLRQLDVLVTRILDQIPTAEIVGFFGPQFWNAFQSNVEILPSGLIIPIFHIFLDNIRKHYIKQQSAQISDNVVHAEALFNHFLENLKLSPALATQLCQGLDHHVKDICGPLLNDFLSEAKDWVKYEDRSDEKKSSKIVKQYSDSGVPKHAQAGISLYHIFVTFENYCRNRFFPSHNTPESADLADEAASHFAKLESSVRLDQLCSFISAVRKATKSSKSKDTTSVAWRFRSVLFNSALQRSVKLYKIITAAPPANLPSLVRRHEQVDNLKDLAFTELTSLLQFISSEFSIFEKFVQEREEAFSAAGNGSNNVDARVATKASSASSRTTWHVNNEPSYWIYFWDSLCAHAALASAPQSPIELSQSFVRHLISLRRHLSVSKASTGSKAIKSSETDDHFLSTLASSSLSCWLSASFYEVEGIRTNLIRSVVSEVRVGVLGNGKEMSSLNSLLTPLVSSKLLSKTHTALESISSRQKKASTSDSVVSDLVMLNSLPSSLWTLDDILFALPTLSALLMASVHTGADRSVIVSLLHSCSALLAKAITCRRPAVVDDDNTPAVAILKVLDPEQTFEFILEKTYVIAPFESSELLSSLVELATHEHASQSKAFKFIDKASDAARALLDKDDAKDSDKSRALHFLQAILQGMATAFETLDEKASIQLDWIRQNQRNNVGWKSPPQKFVTYNAKLQKLLNSLYKYFSSLSKEFDSKSWSSFLQAASEGSATTLPAAELQRSVLIFRSLYSLLDIARLQRTRFAMFLDKKDAQVHQGKADLVLPLPSDLRLPTYIALVKSVFFTTSKPSSMEVDDSANSTQAVSFQAGLLEEICYSSFSSLSRSLSVASDLISDDAFGSLSSTLHSLLLDESQGTKAKRLLAILVPNLSPFRCRFLLSYVMYELHKLTSREKLILTEPTWKLGSHEKEDDRVRSLFVILEVLAQILKLIDPAVAYDVLSQYSSKLLTILCSIIETASFGTSLGLPLSNARHVLVISLITQLIGDKFVDLSGSELNATSGLLNVVLAKHHAIQNAPLLLQLTQDLNLSVPLSTWSSIVIFAPSVVTAYYHLLSTSLHARPLQTNKNLATLILNAKILLYAVALRTNPDNLQALRTDLDVSPLKKIHAEYVGRLYKDLANQGKFMRSFAVHIIIDYVVLLQRETISQPIKIALNTGMHPLIALLEENEQNLILKAVDATGKAIFRQLVQDYERDYRYQGKA